MPEHRRRQDQDGIIHERETDNDAWARLDLWATRYKIAWGFWLLLVALGGFIGGRIVRPLNAIPAVVAGQAAIAARLGKVETSQTETTAILGILVRMQCLQLNLIDRAKINLNCRDIPLTQREATQ